MPEHLDDFDLDSHIDRAFADLLEDVGGRTTPPPASTIIERARRRRTTTFAAAAAVVLIAGGVAVASDVGRPTAAPGPAGQLPAPTVLDGKSWSAATAGWVENWQTISENDEPTWLDNPQGPRCLTLFPIGTVLERRGSLNLTSNDQVLARTSPWGFADSTATSASWGEMADAMDTCSGTTPLHQLTWDGASAQSYVQTSKNGPQYVWLVREDQAIGIAWVAGDASPLPKTIDTQIMTTIAAGLQDPDSFKETEPITAGSSSAALPYRSIPEEGFAAALGSWDSGWERRGDKNPDTSLPCLSPSSNSAFSGGAGSSLGTNGGFEVSQYTYESAAAAEWESLASELTSCNSAAWTVSTIGTRPQVLVASSGVGVAWIVRNGSNIGVVTIAGGHVDPPARVSVAVGDVIDQQLMMETP